MADFLTRLIERSRDLTLTQQVEPLIAPFYAVGPHTALPDDAMDEELTSVAEPESQPRAPAPRITEVTLAHRPEENISIAPSPQRHEPRDKVTTEIKSARASADEKQSAQLNQTPDIKPLPQATTPKSPLPPANERPGLTVSAADQSRRANAEPLVIRPQPLARADESNSRATEATNDTAAPIIRVTIGRIDVRAVPAPTPTTRRAESPAPKLSLEEYLRSRTGRR